MIFNSGSPYNVTVGGQDLDDDSLFNDRPGFGTNPLGSCPFPTAAACSYYIVPATPSHPIPINYLTGPSPIHAQSAAVENFRLWSGNWRQK